MPRDFLKLTHATDHKPIWVNMGQVSFYLIDSLAGAKIVFRDAQYIVVDETPDEIQNVWLSRT